MKKCVLLYSGGLDTSCSIKLIKDRYGYDVISLTIDVGQSENLEEVRDRAIEIGAKEAYLIDAKKEFADKYISKSIKANGLYEGSYPLSSALSRYLMAELGVKLAEEIGAEAIAHGCSGKGNDQIRFDLTISALNPKLKIIAPIRELNLNRRMEIEYARKHGIIFAEEPVYSVDENLWGRSIECGVLEDLNKEPPEEIFKWVMPAQKAPDDPCYIELEFDRGIPKKLNGEEMELWKLISKLNEEVGRHGVGIIDHIEDRVIGLKSREVYECPAASVILEAHRDLEKLVCTKHEIMFKAIVDQKWAELVYSGLWVDPLRNDLESFIDSVDERVSGIVRIKLYKGSMRIVERSSPNALYKTDLISYEEEGFDQRKALGFIELWGLQSRIARIVRR